MATTLDQLSRALVELDEDRVLEFAREIAADQQTSGTAVLAACQHALRVIGERYERRDYSLAALIMAGELFKEIMELVEPVDDTPQSANPRGTIVLGTVAGDIHDIGKDIFHTALRSHGFEVVDLGVDVPKQRFLLAATESRPGIVCLSGLISVAFTSMKETTQYIRSHEPELGYRPSVVIGGATIDSRVAEYVEADSWSTDAMEGVHICLGLMGRSSD